MQDEEYQNMDNGDLDNDLHEVSLEHESDER